MLKKNSNLDNEKENRIKFSYQNYLKQHPQSKMEFEHYKKLYNTKIGKTSSGKDIYAIHDHHEHEKFNSQDHKDSVEVNKKRIGYLNRVFQKKPNNETKQKIDFSWHQLSSHFKSSKKTPPPPVINKSQKNTILPLKNNKKTDPKILGFTSSGKAVYKNFDHESHSTFSSDEHREAAKLHGNRITEIENKIKQDPDNYDLRNEMNYHWQQFFSHLRNEKVPSEHSFVLPKEHEKLLEYQQEAKKKKEQEEKEFEQRENQRLLGPKSQTQTNLMVAKLLLKLSKLN